MNASAPRGLRRLASPFRRRPASAAADPYRTLWDAAFEPLIEHVDGRIVDTNPAFRTTFGYTADEAVRLTVLDLTEQHERPLLAERIRDCSEAPFELIAQTKTGEPRYLEASVRTIAETGAQTRRILALRDVTDRRQAEEEAGVLAFQYAADLTVVAEVARRLPRTADAASARLAICEAAIQVCDGAMAVLMEPDGRGNLVSTAMAGAHSQPLIVPLDQMSSATAQVFASREPFFADLSTHGGVSPQLVEASGLVTALWQPVLRDGDPVGVLLVAWDRHVTLISDRAAAVVGLFAAEAAVAVERVDILARLDELNTALAQQVEALRLSDQFKTDFVSSVSHELRTPLASILGYTDILVNGEVGEMTPDQEEFLEIIDHNARRLLALINDLLTLSGLESGRMVIRPEPVDLCELVRKNLQIHIPAINTHMQRLEAILPDTPVVAVIDSERISQVLTNLMSNAIKFTPDEGRLGIELRAEGDDAVLAVSDSGIGISDDDRERLFERFFRAGNAMERAIPGTGLGLAICKGIVDAHSGRLQVESTLGHGTAVTVTLPLQWGLTEGDDE
ncbi:MAG TPA: PAS domain-containing sensor histidine kinase [Gaiellales bacterium]